MPRKGKRAKRRKKNQSETNAFQSAINEGIRRALEQRGEEMIADLSDYEKDKVFSPDDPPNNIEVAFTIEWLIEKFGDDVAGDMVDGGWVVEHPLDVPDQLAWSEHALEQITQIVNEKMDEEHAESRWRSTPKGIAAKFAVRNARISFDKMVEDYGRRMANRLVEERWVFPVNNNLYTWSLRAQAEHSVKEEVQITLTTPADDFDVHDIPEEVRDRVGLVPHETRQGNVAMTLVVSAEDGHELVPLLYTIFRKVISGFSPNMLLHVPNPQVTVLSQPGEELGEFGVEVLESLLAEALILEKEPSEVIERMIATELKIARLPHDLGSPVSREILELVAERLRRGSSFLAVSTSRHGLVPYEDFLRWALDAGLEEEDVRIMTGTQPGMPPPKVLPAKKVDAALRRARVKLLQAERKLADKSLVVDLLDDAVREVKDGKAWMTRVDENEVDAIIEKVAEWDAERGYPKHASGVTVIRDAHLDDSGKVTMKFTGPIAEDVRQRWMELHGREPGWEEMEDPNTPTDPLFRVDEDHTSTVWLPTATLVRFQAASREAGLERTLTDAEIKLLDIRGRHIVYTATMWMHEKEGDVSFVRAKLLLAIKEGVDTTAWSEMDESIHSPRVVLDFLPEQFGAFMEGMEADLLTHSIKLTEIDAGKRQLKLDKPLFERPEWAAARAFNQVWEQAENISNMTLWWAKHKSDPHWKSRPEWDDITDLALSPRALMSMQALEIMKRSQLLVIEPDMMNALPPWDDAYETWDFASDLHLPFDPLFLDFTGPGGIAPVIDVHMAEGSVVLTGALIYREAGVVNVMPTGWFSEDDGSDIKTEQRTKENPGLVGNALGLGFHRFSILGRMRFGGETPKADVEYLRLRAHQNGNLLNELSSTVAVVRPGFLFTREPERTLEGRVETPHLIGRDDSLPDAPSPDPAWHARGWGQVVALLASRALSAISLLQAANVEIAEATNVSRQVKRQVLRDGGEIGLMVLVRKTRYTENGKPTGQSREYSHAFWRVGHYKHFPLGTRMADAMANVSATKLVNHPVKGLCRKIWCPPHVVGSQDGMRDAVVKTRVWKRDATGKKRTLDGSDQEAA